MLLHLENSDSCENNLSCENRVLLQGWAKVTFRLPGGATTIAQHTFEFNSSVIPSPFPNIPLVLYGQVFMIYLPFLELSFSQLLNLSNVLSGLYGSLCLLKKHNTSIFVNVSSLSTFPSWDWSNPSNILPCWRFSSNIPSTGDFHPMFAAGDFKPIFSPPGDFHPIFPAGDCAQVCKNSQCILSPESLTEWLVTSFPHFYHLS